MKKMLRRSERIRKQTIFYNNVTEIKKKVKKNKKIEKKPQTFLKSFFADILENTNMREDSKETRSIAFKTSIKKANEIINNGLIYLKDSTTYLITSSDRTFTYTVKLGICQNKLKLTCNCGDRYSVGERSHCKHILAISLYNLKTITNDFFVNPENHTILTRSMTKKLSNFTMSENKKDYFSELIQTKIKS